MLKQFSICCVLFFALALCTCANAQQQSGPLADRVPADAVAYLGWAGADSQATAYQSSDLSTIIDHSNLPQVAASYLPKLWDQLADADDDKQAVTALQKSLALLWHHPLAIYASNVTINPDGSPDANFALVCDAGPDVTELRTDLESAIQADTHLKLVVDGSLITISSGEAARFAPGLTLADQPAFLAAMKSLQPSPAIAIYVDAKTILEKATRSAETNEKSTQIWPKVRDALGITTVKNFALTAGFDKNNWQVTSTLNAPSPRTGLLAAVEPKPIDPVLLTHIPASAGSVAVYNFDAAKIFDTIGQAMASDPNSDKLFHQAAGLATIALGRNFRQQILGPLGSQWVLYSDSKLHSIVVLNHPTDPDTASDSIVSAVFGLANLANTQLPGAATQPVINLEQKTINGVDLTSAVTKLIAPTFAVKDGIFFTALSQDALVTSATLPPIAPANDILHGKNFAAALYRLGVPTLGSFDYCNLPDTAPLAYNNFAPAGQQLRQMMTMFNIDLPKIELPPLDQLKAHLSPALSVSWANDQGVYSKSVSPFPLSTYLLGDPQQSMVGTTMLSTTITVIAPALQRARQQALVVKSMSNERQILLALIIYAQKHRGSLPPDLGTLISDGAMQPADLAVFLQPNSKLKVPQEIATGTKPQQAAWVNDNAEYVFLLPSQRLSDIQNAPQTAELVPKDAENQTTRVPVGFVDGHAEMCKPQRVQRWLHPSAPPDNP